MKLVINIPEEIYEEVCQKENPYRWLYRDIALEAISKGTILPKGHGRLIDVDDIENHIIGSVDTRDCPTIIEADKEGKQ